MYFGSFFFPISPNKTLNVSAASNFPGTNITTGAADTTDESDCYIVLRRQ